MTTALSIDAENDGSVVWRLGTIHGLNHACTIRIQSLDYPDDVDITTHAFKISK
ncbi:MAG: hypothetical protein J7M38_14100 [Armatimonadetes bacterium]|nr:hypothetical protein [Armatimonadota bacterium]